MRARRACAAVHRGRRFGDQGLALRLTMGHLGELLRQASLIGREPTTVQLPDAPARPAAFSGLLPDPPFRQARRARSEARDRSRQGAR